MSGDDLNRPVPTGVHIGKVMLNEGHLRQLLNIRDDLVITDAWVHSRDPWQMCVRVSGPGMPERDGRWFWNTESMPVPLATIQKEGSAGAGQ